MGSVKLLNRTFFVYIVSSIIVLLVAAPIFYFSMVYLYINDIDETLHLYKKEFKHYYLPNFKQSEIESWNKYNRDMKIEPSDIYTNQHTAYFYKDFFDVLDDEKEPYRVMQSPIVIENKPYIFTARISLVETEDLIESIAVVFVVLIGLLLGVLIFVTNRFSKKIWQPFHSTLEKLKSFDLTTRQGISFDKTNIKEFEELNQSLQKLIDKNISVYNQQKTFIENASHELQTPLAILKSKLNLLLQNKNITSEQAELLTAIDLPLARMTRINKNLLLLAKIENKQFSEVETIELTKVINETLELLSDYITTKQIIVDNGSSTSSGQAFAEKLSVVCNKTLLEILVSNLLINSIIHNSENGKINISTSFSADIDFPNKTLTVSNTGKTALNNEKLFERFAVASSQNTNSGLGLAIVKEICNRYQWQISYAFENGFHSFTIKFL